MKTRFLILALVLIFSNAVAQNIDSIFIRKIYNEGLTHAQSYENLRYLCKKIGPRLSGSANAQKAVDWGKKVMNSYGFDRVYLQEVMVPHWVRGQKESAFLIDGSIKTPIALAALGGSIATPKNGITANVIEVKSLAELKNLGEKVIKGKIVFFNRAFDPKHIETFLSYRDAVDQRGNGAIEAARFGAIAVLVRSMTHAIDNHPHTGAMRYDNAVTKIPAAAISTEAANMLSRRLMLRKLPLTKIFIKMNCQTLPDAKSYNVIGEITGSEKPNEIITVGGHLDSWDLAEGAHDDGAGCVQSIETLRTLKALGYKPKHTIRAVLFMNEENGLRGGLKYAELAKKNNESPIVAIESDEGGFTPRGFSFETPESQLSALKKWASLFKPYLTDDFEIGDSGSDIGPLRDVSKKTVLIGLKPDSQRYFDYHHANNDVFENVNKRELELGSAAIASLVYLFDQYGIPTQ